MSRIVVLVLLSVAWAPWVSAQRAGSAAAAALEASTAVGAASGSGLPDNVLLIIADDFGREKLGVYGVHPDPAPTPVLDQLSKAGVSFAKFYSQPVCSPTRAAILTGRQAFRTGIGTGVPWKQCQQSLSGCFEWDVDGALTLPRALRATHASAAIGKWHLGVFADGRGWMHPIRAGFHWFLGAKQNLGGSGADPQVYFEWEKNVASTQGAFQHVETTYATTDNVDDALEFIGRMREQPWFTWLAFNSAHTPYHVPPDELQPVTDAQPSSLPWRKHKAMVEAMDAELGRLLSGIRPDVLARTWIIFLCDNGEGNTSVQPPYPPPSKTKPEPWEGNINVPLIVVGPDVVAPGRMADQLVHAVDVYASVCELAGVPVPAEAVDSVSFVSYLLDPAAESLRDVVFSERFRPNGPGPYLLEQFAVTDGRWKWGIPTGPVFGTGGGERLYDLLNDPNETQNLLTLPALTAEQQAALDFLRLRRDEILASHGGGL